MFGYITPIKNQMNEQDFSIYRSIYCGMCKQLGNSYGLISRFLLNYDLVLIATMADALSGEKGLLHNENCFANPVVKRETLYKTKGLTLGADALIMLSYHKIIDNLQDEKAFKHLGYSIIKPLFAKFYKKAALRHSSLHEVFTNEMKRQLEIEASKTSNLDIACDPTAQMCKAIFGFAGNTVQEKQTLERLGLFSGQISYILDAVEDFDDDKKHNKYNPLVLSGLQKNEAIEQAKLRCRMAAGEIAICYNLLNLKQYKPILDNIFFLGLPHGIAAAGNPKTRRQLNGLENSVPNS